MMLTVVFRTYCRFERLAAAFAPLVDLIARLYLFRVFFWSGLTKINDWGTTVALFTDEYHVPVLPPVLAAIMGTGGELVLSVLLLIGLAGRFAAAGLFVLNAVAVVSYYHVLAGTPGLVDHGQWALMLAWLAVHGCGAWAVDHWLRARFAPAR